MGRRTKIFLFFVVFGLPICWYLFLQFFGKNNYELETIRPYEVESCEFNTPAIITRDDLISRHPNQFERLSRRFSGSTEIGFYGMIPKCVGDADILLIDDQKMIKGAYKANREDVDRLLAEVDIFLMNRSNETGNSEK